MPGSALLPALISAGGQLIGQGANMFSQGSMNRKSREWNEQMYARQRQDALSDWTMQNEYNSPQAQMQRFRDAGLNPNLIYGRGESGQSMAPRSTDMQSWKPEAPRIDLSGASNSLMQYYDIQMKEAQIDNLKVQNTVAQQEALLKTAQTLSISAGTDKTVFDTQLAKELRYNTIETAQAQLRKMEADTDYTLNQDERAAAQNAISLQKAVEEILTLRLGRAETSEQIRAIQAQIQSVYRDVRLKDLDIELKRLGIQPGDNMAARIIGRIVGDPSKLNLDLRPGKLRSGQADSLKVPRKSGYQLFLERRNK